MNNNPIIQKTINKYKLGIAIIIALIVLITFCIILFDQKSKELILPILSLITAVVLLTNSEMF